MNRTPMDDMLNNARSFTQHAATVGTPLDRKIADMLHNADANNMTRTLNMLAESRIAQIDRAADADVDTPDHAARVYRRAQEYGGSFAHAWGAAMQTAHGASDWPTLHALRVHFPQLWDHYMNDGWDR